MAPHRTETARLRRVPRYGVFLILGAVLGVVAALVLTTTYYDPETESVTGLHYSFSQIFGFLCMFGIPLGLVVGGGIALLLDRMLGRRAQTVRIDRETVRAETDEHAEPSA